MAPRSSTRYSCRGGAFVLAVPGVRFPAPTYSTGFHVACCCVNPWLLKWHTMKPPAERRLRLTDGCRGQRGKMCTASRTPREFLVSIVLFLCFVFLFHHGIEQRLDRVHPVASTGSTVEDGVITKHACMPCARSRLGPVKSASNPVTFLFFSRGRVLSRVFFFSVYFLCIFQRNAIGP